MSGLVSKRRPLPVRTSFQALLSIAKLLEHYDPFHHLGHNRRSLSYYLSKVEPMGSYIAPSQRHRGYTRRRIAWFLRHGWDAVPSVDWVWNGVRPVRLIFVDGHHRFCAAILSGDTHLLVEYGGPVSAIPSLS